MKTGSGMPGMILSLSETGFWKAVRMHMDDLAVLKCECTEHFRRLYSDAELVLVYGEGNSASPQLMLIGEAPGAQEVLEGRPFVGKAGKNLDEFLELTGIRREDIYIGNVVKFRPTRQSAGRRLSNRPPTGAEIAAFLPWLSREIALVSPHAIVTLGNVPLYALMGRGASIGSMHGKWHTTPGGRPLFALYHPASVIYRRDLREVYVSDVQALRDTLLL
jgi:uracil-DNA glycosylase